MSMREDFVKRLPCRVTNSQISQYLLYYITIDHCKLRYHFVTKLPITLVSKQNYIIIYISVYIATFSARGYRLRLGSIKRWRVGLMHRPDYADNNNLVYMSHERLEKKIFLVIDYDFFRNQKRYLFKSSFKLT